MAIIDPTTLKQSLYGSKVKLRVLSGTLKLEADQYIDAEALEAMKDAKIRTSFTVPISAEYSAAIGKGKALITALGRDEKITMDSGTLLFLESDTSWYLDQVAFIENHMRGLLAEFDPDRMKEIRDEFEERLFITMRSSFLSLAVSVNMDIQKIEDQCRSSAALYITQKFPDFSEFTNCDVEYDVPSIKVSPVPRGLSTEQEAAYNKKQQDVLMHIWSLLTEQYIALENRAAAGGFHEQNPAIKFVQADILQKIETARTVATDQKARIKDGLVPVSPEEIIDSPMVHQFSLASAKHICKTAEDLINRLSNAKEIDLIADTNAIADRTTMLANLPIFAECAKNWIALNTRRSSKKATAKVSEVVDDVQFADDDDADESVDEVIQVTATTVVNSVQLVDGDDDEDDDSPIIQTVTTLLDEPSNLVDGDDDEDDDEVISLTPVSTASKRRPMARRRPSAS